MPWPWFVKQVNLMEIHDHELVVLTKDAVEIHSDLEGKFFVIAIQPSLTLSDIGKVDLPFYMLKEIDEQPAVMRKLSQIYADEAGKCQIGMKKDC